MTFEQYLAKIDTLAAADGWPRDYTTQTGHEAWRDGYDSGEDPEVAWADEKSYAAESL